MDILCDKKYIPEYLLKDGEELIGWGFVFSEGKLLLKKTDDGYQIPMTTDFHDIIGEFDVSEYIGKYDGNLCFCKQVDAISSLPLKLELVNLRDVTHLTGDTGLFLLAGTAKHLLHWNEINQYCGRCGHQMVNKEDERAKVCTSCGNVVYPRISPATITAIFRGDEILLAHNQNFKGDMYSLISGFVEPGETLEQCVAREIREEIGIKVKNIRYFGSQPWPFPDSLMTAFIADYESGDILVDGVEITKAGWFHARNMPEIPKTDSIAGKIIQWYLKEKVFS